MWVSRRLIPKTALKKIKFTIDIKITSNDRRGTDMIYYYSIFHEISTERETIVDRKKLHYAIYAERRAFYEHLVIKRTRRHPLVVRQHYQDSRSVVNAIFPRDGEIFRSTQTIVLLRRTRTLRGRATLRRRKEFTKGAEETPERKVCASLIIPGEHDRRRSLNHPFKP